MVYPDESGWRIGGLGAWLWAFTNRCETVYRSNAAEASPKRRRCWGKTMRELWLRMDGPVPAFR